VSRRVVAIAIAVVLPEHIWSKADGKAAANSHQDKPPIVGDGPFRIVEWQKGEFVRLKANSTYLSRRIRPRQEED
jgi:peptide/nickel transport system substrate-binding protein